MPAANLHENKPGALDLSTKNWTRSRAARDQADQSLKAPFPVKVFDTMLPSWSTTPTSREDSMPLVMGLKRRPDMFPAISIVTTQPESSSRQ